MCLVISLCFFVATGLSYETERPLASSRTSATAGLPFQTNLNSISGHVSNTQRAPVADVRVELLNDVDAVIQTVKTNGSGLFVFRRLSDGVFQVRIQTSGTNYVSQTKRVDLARPHGLGATFEDIEFILTTPQNSTASTKPGVVFVQEVPEEARKQFQRAFELLQKSNKRQDGLAALKSALEIYPQYFDALELLGTNHVQEHEYEPAIPVLSRALEVNSRAYPSWFALGVAQFNLKQLQPAIESLRKAVLLNEKSINANLWLGIALRQTSRPDEAENYLKRADQLADSKLPDVHWQLALLFNNLKRYNEAADQLELFLKVQPDAKDSELIRKLITRFRQQAAARSKP